MVGELVVVPVAVGDHAAAAKMGTWIPGFPYRIAAEIKDVELVVAESDLLPAPDHRTRDGGEVVGEELLSPEELRRHRERCLGGRSCPGFYREASERREGGGVRTCVKSRHAAVRDWVCLRRRAAGGECEAREEQRREGAMGHGDHFTALPTTTVLAVSSPPLVVPGGRAPVSQWLPSQICWRLVVAHGAR